MSTLKMSTWMPTTTVDDFLHYLSTGDDPHGRISDDVVAEMTFPHTTLTVSGKTDFDQLRAHVSDRPWVLRAEPAVPIPGGFVVAVQYDAHQDGGTNTFHSINVVTLTGDQITGLRHWCSGSLR